MFYVVVIERLRMSIFNAEQKRRSYILGEAISRWYYLSRVVVGLYRGVVLRAVLRLCIELISSVQRAFGGCLGAKRR